MKVGRLAFHSIGYLPHRALALLAGSKRHVKDNSEVERTVVKNLFERNVHYRFPIQLLTAVYLVGKKRNPRAVGYHVLPRKERGHNDLRYMLSPVGQKQEKFGRQSHVALGAVEQHLAEFLAERRAARLAGVDKVPFRKRLPKEGDLGVLAGTVTSLHNDIFPSFVHKLCAPSICYSFTDKNYGPLRQKNPGIDEGRLGDYRAVCTRQPGHLLLRCHARRVLFPRAKAEAF